MFSGENGRERTPRIICPVACIALIAPKSAPTPVSTLRGLRLKRLRAMDCAVGTMTAAMEDRPVKAQKVNGEDVSGERTSACERMSRKTAARATRRSKDIITCACAASDTGEALDSEGALGLKREMMTARL
jgi:hypothetical protein